MPRILLVESDAPLRHVVARILVQEGHDVHEAADSAAGLELWHKQGADVVLTDLRKVGTSSIEAILELRTFVASLPIIVMPDGVSDLERLAEAQLIGTVSLLTKPFTLTDLLGAIAAATPSDSRSDSSRIA
ncbi:MAG TPA: response regulator [Gemmatimonadales bacterium]|nr:response regulator [Gemmatimonadales bacterium]